MNAEEYHRLNRPGKIEIIPTKPYFTQKYLSMAYSPGVAEPSIDIYKDPSKIYEYTIKGNLVGVISNGTAVLGLGDIGPEASKPVMEGKALLFKIFADIDAFDIEINSKNPDEFIDVVKKISPTFGAINIEDVKAPECFEIEEQLIDSLEIPIMHDDQHGTAVIVTAALINALKINGKKLGEILIVINGAGAAAIATARMFKHIGVPKDNIIMCDSKGVIRKKDNDNIDNNKFSYQKEEFATSRDLHTLQEALKGADVFIGLSKGNILTTDMLNSMSYEPIVFALANPIPEIEYEIAIKSRGDIIFGTGRSDYPNQINNVLGFPYIFRGALDVQARRINYQMKEAAAIALAELARKPIPESVLKAYDLNELSFGKNYLIPKPLDYRLISEISCAVAKAAVYSGVAEITPDGKKIPQKINNKSIDNPSLHGVTLDSPSELAELPEDIWIKYKASLQKRIESISGICYRCKIGK
jgi:Malic enzyme